MAIDKKAMKAQYMQQAQDIPGCVFMVTNTQNGKIYIDIDPSLKGALSKFEFAKKQKTCTLPQLQRDFLAHGDVFVYEILEQLEKKQEQSLSAFKEDLNMLADVWREKFADKEFYPR